MKLKSENMNILMKIKKILSVVIVFLGVVCAFMLVFAGRSQLNILYRVNQESVLKVYFDTRSEENPFDERNVSSLQLSEQENEKGVIIPLWQLSKLRIDLAEMQKVTLRGIRVKVFNIELVSYTGSEIMRYLKTKNNIILRENQGEMQLVSIGDHPYIYIENLELGAAWIKIVGYAMIAGMMVLIGLFAIEKMPISKEMAIIMSSIFYITVSIAFLITHKGYFAFDEFYHISTLNPNYITDYDRANYINVFARFVCQVFGKSNLTVKVIPFVCGLISYCGVIFLAYRLYDNPYWILTVSSIFTCMPSLIYNHFYIRMYVFLEAIVVLNSILLYNSIKEKGKKKFFYILISIILTLFYCANTKDFSAQALLVLMIIAIIYCVCDKKIVGFLGCRVGKIMLGIFLAICVAGIFMILAIKQGAISIPLLNNIIAIKSAGITLGNLLLEFYHASEPVFFKYIVINTFFVSFPFILSLLYIVRKKESKTAILYIIAGLPLLGYMVFFYNSYILRSYIAFWPMLCVTAYTVFDKLEIPRWIHGIIIGGCIILTLEIQPDFWAFPRMPNETGSSDLGEAVERAKDLEKQGYEIVTMMTYKTQAAYFDLLDVAINLNIADIEEENLDDAYILEKIDKMISENEQYVIIADWNGMNKFDELILKVGNTTEYVIEEFAGHAYVVLIN